MGHALQSSKQLAKKPIVRKKKPVHKEIFPYFFVLIVTYILRVHRLMNQDCSISTHHYNRHLDLLSYIRKNS